MKNRLLCCGVLFAGLLLGASGAAAQPFAVGPLSAQPGERISGFLEVPDGVDKGTRIPITILHGVKPGPVLALIAGTHGYEYAPVMALQKMRGQIDPQELAGTVILVHIANLPSFLGRTIYYSPIDAKNLNRVYPGKTDGTVSERIAYAITTEIIDRADYVVDLHCGDGNEALRPYAYWGRSSDSRVDEASRQLALAFGLDHIVIETARPTDPAASTYTDNTALTRGKPAITTETGQLGETGPQWVGLVERGVWNLLRHLKMIAGELQPPLQARAWQTVWIDRYEVLRSPETGIFYAEAKPGYAVAQGALLGRLTDLFGNPLADIRAPFAGIVNYVVATPPVSKGEPLAMVGHIRKEE